MPPFPLADLALPTACILLAGLVLAYVYTRNAALSWTVASIKAGLFFLYFGFLFDGTYTFLDDWRYLHIGEQLAASNVGLLSLIDRYHYIVSTVAGSNIAYYVYNASAVRLFGFGYYAPVAINVILTFLGAGLLMRAARSGLGMSRRVSVGLYALLALSPSILAWSTIPNFKDTLVATATAGAVYAVALVDRRCLLRAGLLALAATFVLAVTRLYVPLMLGAAFGITLFLSPRGRRNPWLWLLALVAMLVVLRYMGHGSLIGALHKVRSQMDNPVVGVVRFLVTPIPFHSAAGYSFMNIPQLIYWALMPLMLYGMLQVWRTAGLTGRFMVIYFVLMILLYGSFTTLQGARHRVQVDGVIALFQYFGLLAALRHRFRQHARPAPPLELAPAGAQQAHEGARR